MKIGASFRKVNVKPHSCIINVETVTSKVSRASKTHFLLMVEEEKGFGFTFYLLHSICFNRQDGLCSGSVRF